MKNYNNKQGINDLIVNLMIQSCINEMMLKDILKRNNLKSPGLEEYNEISRQAKERVNVLLSSFNLWYNDQGFI